MALAITISLELKQVDRMPCFVGDYLLIANLSSPGKG
jgi:hypothetical protein